MRELEAKIEAWRVEARSKLPAATVQELEQHLRDHLAHDVVSAIPLSEDALRKAIAQLGDLDALAREFRRAKSRWFATVDSREFKLLAYFAGCVAVLVVVAEMGALLHGIQRLLRGKPIAPGPIATTYALLVASSIVAVGWTSLRVCNRFLHQPQLREARGIIAFMLFFVWMLASQLVFMRVLPYEIKLVLIAACCSGLVLLWRVWVVHISRHDEVSAGVAHE